MTDQKPTSYGAVLRRRREEMGLSLADMAASTRIRKTYLQALEDENLRMLPGSAYVVGFLRIYARQLGLAADPLLAALPGHSPQDHGHPRESAGPGDNKPRRKAHNNKAGGRFVFLIVALLLAVAVFFYLRPGSSPPRETPVAPPAPVVAPQPAAAPATPQASLPTPQAAADAPQSQAPSQGQPVEFPVIPPGGAVVRIVPVATGSMKVSLDAQESREYPLQPQQPLNWKVAGNLSVELSAPGIVRVWVDKDELAISEPGAFVLTRRLSAQERP